MRKISTSELSPADSAAGSKFLPATGASVSASCCCAHTVRLPWTYHLRAQQTAYRLGRSRSRLLPQRTRHKRRSLLAASYVPQYCRRFRHGIVIQGDGVMVATLQRPHLRPAAVRKLRRQQVFNTAQKACTKARSPPRPDTPHSCAAGI